MLSRIEYQFVIIFLLVFSLMILGFSAVNNSITRITFEHHHPPIGLSWGQDFIYLHWFGKELKIDVDNIYETIGSFSYQFYNVSLHYYKIMLHDGSNILAVISDSIVKLYQDTKLYLDIWYDILKNNYIDKNNSSDLELIRI